MLDEDLGYFEPRSWHRDRPQKPKVWSGPSDIWGPPPTQSTSGEGRHLCPHAIGPIAASLFVNLHHLFLNRRQCFCLT